MRPRCSGQRGGSSKSFPASPGSEGSGGRGASISVQSLTRRLPMPDQRPKCCHPHAVASSEGSHACSVPQARVRGRRSWGGRDASRSASWRRTACSHKARGGGGLLTRLTRLTRRAPGSLRRAACVRVRAIQACAGQVGYLGQASSAQGVGNLSIDRHQARRAGSTCCVRATAPSSAKRTDAACRAQGEVGRRRRRAPCGRT